MESEIEMKSCVGFLKGVDTTILSIDHGSISHNACMANRVFTPVYGSEIEMKSCVGVCKITHAPCHRQLAVDSVVV